MSRSIESDYEFGAYDDDYRGFDIRDDETNRGPLILALALGILIVFGAVVWNTYRQGVRTGDNGLPMITAAETPYKSTPQDRGGTVTPDLDARIYDQMDGAERPLQSVAATAPTGQVLPPLPQGDTLSGGPDETSTSSNPIIIDQARNLETLRGDVDVSSARDVASLEPIAPSLPEPQIRPLPKPPVEEIRSAPRFAFDSGGNYLVQISALRSEAAAERAWREATRKSPDLFEGSEKRIQRADLGSKGVFYRLRVGAFAERGAATDFCSALKTAKHQCIVVQN